jgi:hypothetical protein
MKNISLRLLSCLMLLLAAPLAFGAESPRSNFDHLLTGFPLTGVHASTPCETCHVGGRFRGTPKDCAFCHSAGGRIAVSVKPFNHVPTQEPCEQCHRSASTWTGARFSHASVTPGDCMRCHNGTYAPGKSASHIQTASPCDTCHRTTFWAPARFNHANVTPGSCATCHNGSQARGKPANHVQTTAACDQCHSTSAWTPARFNHASVTPGSCATCHNGSQARGKPANHIVTNEACDQCHRTSAWTPATFRHTNVVPGSCATCHNGTTARGKSGGHFVTSLACDACHTTSAWSPTTRYAHTTPYFRPHNSSVTCRGCHTGNSETATWVSATYRPDCAGCHAARYRTGPHKKTTTPTTISYTVDELRDCSGSCHEYTDATFTTIKKTRSSKHRSTDGGF